MSWLCFATGCRFCSLSWQARSAGRNLITLFLTVNNPREKFSRRPPLTHAPKRCPERPSTPSTTPLRQRARPATRPRTERKTLKRSTFANEANTCDGRCDDEGGVLRRVRRRSSTGSKRRRKLFTSVSAFCFRFGRNAQTFDRRSAVFGRHSTPPVASKGSLEGVVSCASRAHFPHVRITDAGPRAKKNGRTWRPSGVRKSDLSGRRFPGLRHRRPDPAGR